MRIKKPASAERNGSQHRALNQLDQVSQLRHGRLQRALAALAERERVWAAAMARQQQDEQLLAEQKAQWRQRWQAWREQGGALAVAARLRGQRDDLQAVAELLAQRHAALLQRQAQLARERADWTHRWLAAQALDSELTRRGAQLQRQADAATERRQDEDALQARNTSSTSSSGISSTRRCAPGLRSGIGLAADLALAATGGSGALGQAAGEQVGTCSA
ncbi:hypothetical protein [Aquabacterium sp. OR-4]|uniref:hypothetical protein n=1 Tax=Aquabacterium sp. OR-4 TaxID=2978127 RepID=UPI0021B28565|nr:hypothetical protein [Aquabacterium sp. OR-4]MDT7836041.1 hypothetical protein [Aquabacterium sp. OR-4]